MRAPHSSCSSTQPLPVCFRPSGFEPYFLHSRSATLKQNIIARSLSQPVPKPSPGSRDVPEGRIQGSAPSTLPPPHLLHQKLCLATSVASGLNESLEYSRYSCKEWNLSATWKKQLRHEISIFSTLLARWVMLMGPLEHLQEPTALKTGIVLKPP